MRGDVVIAPVLLLLAACGGPATPSSGSGEVASVHGVTLIAAPRSAARFTTRERLVIRTPEAWAEAWARLNASTAPVPPVPEVDFSREMVVLAALGTRRTGGHAASISGATLDGDTLRVEVRETAPGQGCMTTQALTYPVAVARVARHDGAVAFDDQVAARDCT
jgi:hypothetical protein